MKKLIALLLALVMVCGLVACGNKAEAPAADAPAADAPAADAGMTFAIVPKSAGNPYNEREASGFEAGCEALGITPIVQYPEDTSAEAQINVINNLVAQGVNGIAVAANDAEALESTLEAAKAAGIVVVSLDSDAKGAQLFVNQAGVKEVAQVLVDSIYDMSGGAGEFAVLSASSTATNQNAWIAAMEEIIAADEKYANLTWVETVYGDDEPQKSTDEAQSLMTKYPNLKVICCPTTVGVLACAQAVQNAGSSIKVAGLGLPSEMKDYVGDDKVCPYMYLWNPIDVGNCAAYMIDALAEGKVGEIGTSFEAKNGTSYEVMAGDPAAKQIIVGPPFAFTGENIAEWAEVY